MNYFFSILFVFIASQSFAQILEGQIFNETDKQTIPAAIVYWDNTNDGVSADENGKFSIPITSKDSLVISAIGYIRKKIKWTAGLTYINIYLSPIILKEVIVKGKNPSTYISKIEPIKTQIITIKDLNKSACCNLSEAFENNASVDVMITDAISGSKQLRMLGLEGVYSTILQEGQPMIYGLAIPFGLELIPGSWLFNIQLNTGVGSVVNGHESISGNINSEFIKPDKADLLYMNLFGNSNGRIEANVYNSLLLNNKWSELTALHINHNQIDIDANKDGFKDLPFKKGLSVMNRWKYKSDKYVAHLGIQYLRDERIGGQLGHKEDLFDGNKFGTKVGNQRIIAFNRNAKLYQSKPYKGLGLNWLYSHHAINANYFFQLYTGDQNLFLANLIYQSIISETAHIIKLGLSYKIDILKEKLSRINTYEMYLGRSTYEPGAFIEYTYSPNETYTILLAQRADYSANNDIIFTPKFFFKYNINDETTLRLSAGRGFRESLPIAENMALLGSHRQFIFTEKLKPELANNFGINLTQQINIGDREGHLILEATHTQFQNQTVVNMHKYANQILLSNLTGRSYASVFQIEYFTELFKGLDLKTAFRYNKVMTTYNESIEEKYMVPHTKSLVQLSYTSNYEKLKINASAIRNGKQRIADAHKESAFYSKPFWQVLGQISYRFKSIEIYFGIENALDYTQDNPIISADNFMNPTFDTATIWAPVLGRTLYGGLRYSIK